MLDSSSSKKSMFEQQQAEQIIESLRSGIPPAHGTRFFSVGNENLLDGIKRRHLKSLENKGLIRFISGSWGSGKTHFFRLVRDLAFEEKCLVSNVQLSVDNAALNKFDQVFAEIIRKIITPTSYAQAQDLDIDGHRHLLVEALGYLATGFSTPQQTFTHEEYSIAKDALMADQNIDIDFKKMVMAYWQTFLPDNFDLTNKEQKRSEILQWFIGEGKISQYRAYGVSKVIDRNNAKLMMQSLAGFVKLAGYRGLVILFDEAEQSYSNMSKRALRDAQNNLLTLINNIEELKGLFLIYATTPDFYNDPRHGIQQYGALATRIGQPDLNSPRSLNKIWNFDAIEVDLSEYQTASLKIREIYISAYAEDDLDDFPAETEVKDFVSSLHTEYSEFAGVRFWRVMVSGLIDYCDSYIEGEILEAEEIYASVMDRLKE